MAVPPAIHGPGDGHIQWEFAHGIVEGMLVHPREASDLVIITNGHNGFYSYGMFPWIQAQLARAGMASFSYNFSHGGTVGDGDVFEDLTAYAANCMRLETADLEAVGITLARRYPGARLWLLSHSMGAIPNLYGTLALARQGVELSGLIFLSPVSRLDFWPETLIDQWKETGTIHMSNRRTKQDLPHGPELLREILNADRDWNMGRDLAFLSLPVLVVHGEEDEAVDVRHGRQVAEWAKAAGNPSTFIGIPGAGHTFGTAHPFQGPADTTRDMILAVIDWIRMHHPATKDTEDQG